MPSANDPVTKSGADAPAQQPEPPTNDDPAAVTPDADKAEPAPHERPVRSDDN
ncbi:hypothetical protein [Caballeronia sp. Lep1P3]|uniref:hypothetical protein n=1 Tax=Caballeronia sp. Lep1P3 TaxID=2878150 RepID=UPI001FD3F2BC|nr:hypothetical protein [Caballeronia sp. Lep1P3]